MAASYHAEENGAGQQDGEGKRAATHRFPAWLMGAEIDDPPIAAQPSIKTLINPSPCSLTASEYRSCPESAHEKPDMAPAESAPAGRIDAPIPTRYICGLGW